MAPRLHTKDSNVSAELVAAYGIEVGKARRELDEASGRHRAVLKRAKAAGVDTKTLIEVLGMKRQDEDAVRLDMRTRLRYAAILAPGIPLKQSDLFDNLPSKPLNQKAAGAQLEWEAEQKGYDTGLNGGGLEDAVYAKGTPAFVAFARGYERGQAVIAERMGENSKQADSRLTKRRGKMAAAGDDSNDDVGETLGNA